MAKIERGQQRALDLVQADDMCRPWNAQVLEAMWRVRDRDATSRHRLETARMLAIPGQDLLALSCVHVVAIGAQADLL